MKKLLFILMFSFTLATIANAQDSKHKAKETSSVPEKAHNMVSKDKKHNGYKTKHKHHKHHHKHHGKTDKVKNDKKDDKS